MQMLRSILLQLFLLGAVSGFDYGLKSDAEDIALSLTDVETGISGFTTMFVDEDHAVTVTGIEWEENGEATNSSVLTWETMVDGEPVANGEIDLSGVGRELPTEIEAGIVKVSSKGSPTIEVIMKVDSSEASASGEYQAYAAGVSIVPLIVVLILAAATRQVEFSLYFAVFVGACIVTGTLKDGFKTTLDDYILNALADVDHGYVYLFTLFLSGLVSLMEKSGGMLGFTRTIGKYASTPRAGQFATFTIGIAVFFDDYANTLLAGQTMRPLTDLLWISREKLAYVVDATAAPIASISPISSWVGFEVGLIQTEIDRIIEIYGEENVTIKTSGMGVFLQSIKYRYYPIFMLVLMPLMIWTQRDMGPMLIAERKTQVYKRTDGGDGRKTKEGEAGGLDEDENAPRPDSPLLWWNMILPVAVLIFLIFYLLVKTGDDGSGEQSFMDKIEGADSYSALLWATMATAHLSSILYLIQFVKGGKLVLPTWPVIKGLFIWSEEDEAMDASNKDPSKLRDEEIEAVDGSEHSPLVVSQRPRPLVPFFEGVESFLLGLARIFPALVVLTLAWASGSMMIAVGADRLFARVIVNGISASALPTVTFVIAMLMALATGTSWGTMTILFPLICLPTYEVSGGDEIIFYATVASILSGSVAGDHVSPISDTTVLSALASDCTLLGHVVTQAPYSLSMALLAILFGTLPIGNDAWPNMVGIALGWVCIGLFVFLLCAPIISKTGRFDPLTQLWMKIKHNEELMLLQEHTVRAFNDDHPVLDGEDDNVEGEYDELKEMDPPKVETDSDTRNETMHPQEEVTSPAEGGEGVDVQASTNSKPSVFSSIASA